MIKNKRKNIGVDERVPYIAILVGSHGVTTGPRSPCLCLHFSLSLSLSSPSSSTPPQFPIIYKLPSKPNPISHYQKRKNKRSQWWVFRQCTAAPLPQSGGDFSLLSSLWFSSSGSSSATKPPPLQDHYRKVKIQSKRMSGPPPPEARRSLSGSISMEGVSVR